MSVLRKSAASVGIAGKNLLTWWARKTAGLVNVLEISLSGQVVEEVYLPRFWKKLFPDHLLSMRDLLSGLDYAADDENIRAVLIRVSRHDLGWGRAAELCAALTRFRAAGKYALVYLEEPENLDSMIAGACDRVALPPGVPFYLTGLLSEVMYFKDVLDKLAIEPEFFQAGKYKSAVEPYTRRGMSRPHREALENLLDSIYEQWIATLAAGRGRSPEEVTAWIDEGPWLAEEAKTAGLVDELLYEDGINGYLEQWLGVPPRRIPLDHYLKLFRPSPSAGDPWRDTEGIALVTATGPIHGGESRSYGGGYATAGADTLRRALREIGETDQIVAAVLRVDSPGGSAVHSDLIWREVEKLRGKKPVVVSMADVAASGGYYIAMPADHIVASSLTLTGSIGVIAGKINLKGLYQKIGIRKEQLRRGEHADMGTDYGPYSPELRSKVRREMETIYRAFLEKAARNRKRAAQEIENAAQGRVWTGVQALRLGLVDELGNLITALERAKERAGIPLCQRVPVFSLPRPPRFSLPAPFFPFPLPFGLHRGLSQAALIDSFSDSSVLALFPFQLRIH